MYACIMYKASIFHLLPWLATGHLNHILVSVCLCMMLAAYYSHLGALSQSSHQLCEQLDTRVAIDNHGTQSMTPKAWQIVHIVTYIYQEHSNTENIPWWRWYQKYFRWRQKCCESFASIPKCWQDDWAYSILNA